MPESKTHSIATAIVHDVFLSYSRKDRDFAVALEAALEQFTPPVELSLPHRQLSVFRDEQDFVGVDYSEAVEHHLRQSGCLIVICSPAAAVSIYVNDEIRRFVAIDPPQRCDRVIPILYRGIPNNEVKPGQEELKAFPDALCEIFQIPLATNFLQFRPARDNFSRGVYSSAWYATLANIYNIGRAEIEDRARRQQANTRRKRTSLAVAIIIVLTIALGFALKERSQALSAARQALARQLAAYADLYSKSDTALAQLLAVAAFHLEDNAETRSGLLTVNEAAPRAARWLSGAPSFGWDVVYSSRGMVATANADGTVTVWDKAGLARTWRVEKIALTVAFSLDGRVLAAAGDGSRSVTLWDPFTGKSIRPPLLGFDDDVISLDFSSTHMAAADRKGTIIIWDLATFTPTRLSGQHGGDVTKVRFSHSGTLLATAGQDRRITLRDAATGQALRSSEADHLDKIYSVAFSPDDKVIASGSADKDAQLWDVVSLRRLGQWLHGHTDSVMDVAFSPDGKHLATAGADGVIGWWDTSSGVRESFIDGHSRQVNSLAFSPDGTRFISTAWDAKTIEWRTSELPRLAREITSEHDGIVHTALPLRDGIHMISGDRAGNLLISPLAGGRTLDRAPFRHAGFPSASAVLSDDSVVLGANDGSIFAIDPVTGKYISHPWRVNKSQINYLASHPTRPLVALASDNGTISVWDVNTHECVLGPLSAHGGSVNAIAFSPDGGWLASGDDSGDLEIWDARRGTLLRSKEYQAGIRHVVFSGDGSKVIFSIFGRIQVVEAKTLKNVVIPIEADRTDVFGLALSRDGEYLATSGADSGVTIWKYGTFKRLRTYDTTESVRVVTFSADGRTIAFGDESGAVSWAEWGTNTPPHVMKQHDSAVKALAFAGELLVSGSRDETLKVRSMNARPTSSPRSLVPEYKVTALAMASDGDLSIIGYNNGSLLVWSSIPLAQIRSMMPNAGSIRALTYSVAGNIYAAATSSGTLLVGRLRGAEPVKVSVGTNFLSSVAVSPDGKLIATGDNEGRVRFWSVRDKRLLNAIFNTGPTSVYALAFSPDGKTLVAGTREGTVVLWDVARNVNTGVLGRHSDRVLALAFNRTGTLLASGGLDQTIVVWDWINRRPMGTPLDAGKGSIYSLVFVDRDLVVGYASGIVLAWRTGLIDWERDACSAAGRDLTASERIRFFPSFATNIFSCTPIHGTNRRSPREMLHDFFR